MKNLNQIQDLNSKQIDEFFFRCGWKDSEKGDNKVLPDWRIVEIMSGEGRDKFVSKVLKGKNPVYISVEHW